MSDRRENLPIFSSSGQEVGIAEGPLRPDSSLSAAIQVWGEELEESGRTINTVKAFTGDMRLLARFMGAGHPINSIGTHDLRNFLDWMLNRRGVPCSPKTYSRRVTSLKAFFRWLVQASVLVEDPAAAIPQESVLSPLPVVLTQDELLAVLKAAEGTRQKESPDARPFTLVSLLLHTGIKKSECLAIHLNHVDLKSTDGQIIWIRYGDVSKRYRERKLSLESNWGSSLSGIPQAVRALRAVISIFSTTTRVFIGGHWRRRRSR